MRKLVYYTENGKETGSQKIAQSWGEKYYTRLDEVHEPFVKWHNPKLKKKNAERGIFY